jgi:hypothetical protein
MQIALGIVFLVGGLLAINWLIHLLFRPIPPREPDDDTSGPGEMDIS